MAVTVTVVFVMAATVLLLVFLVPEQDSLDKTAILHLYWKDPTLTSWLCLPARWRQQHRSGHRRWCPGLHPQSCVQRNHRQQHPTMMRLDPFHPLRPERQDRPPRVPAVVPGHHNMTPLHLGAAEDMASGLSLEDIPTEGIPRVLPGCIRILGGRLGEVRYMEARSLGGFRNQLGAVADDRTANVTGGKRSAFSSLCITDPLSTSSPNSSKLPMRRASKYNRTKYSREDNIPAVEALHIGLVHEEDIEAVLQDSHRILHQAAARRTGDAAEVRRSSLTFLLEVRNLNRSDSKSRLAYQTRLSSLMEVKSNNNAPEAKDYLERADPRDISATKLG